MSSSSHSVSTPTTASSCTTQSWVNNKWPKKIVMPVSSCTCPLQLRAMLEQFCGQVDHVHIHKNRHGDTLAFVRFRWHEDAASALAELEGSKLDGLILHPQWATPRKSAPKPRDKQRKKQVIRP